MNLYFLMHCVFGIFLQNTNSYIANQISVKKILYFAIYELIFCNTLHFQNFLRNRESYIANQIWIKKILYFAIYEFLFLNTLHFQNLFT